MAAVTIPVMNDSCINVSWINTALPASAQRYRNSERCVGFAALFRERKLP
jgi:hypothetical protein